MIGQKHDWPKGRISWREGRTLYVSIPFTWELPPALNSLKMGSLFWDQVIVGGPAVKLMPGYFAALPHVSEGQDMPGVLQRANPHATRTTTGCPNRCGFCGIGRGLIEPGGLVELEDWPDLPILCNNNLLAACRTPAPHPGRAGPGQGQVPVFRLQPPRDRGHFGARAWRVCPGRGEERHPRTPRSHPRGRAARGRLYPGSGVLGRRWK